MAQEYLAIKGKENGMVAISTNVIETSAKICVDEDTDSTLGDTSYFKNAIDCKMEEDKIVLTVKVKVNYNANVNEVCSRLQTNIYDNVKHMTDCRIDAINVIVSGFTI